MKYSLFFLLHLTLFITSISNSYGMRFDVSDEEKIQNLEAKISGRLNKSFKVFYGEDVSFMAQVKIELFDFNKNAKKLSENSDLDYLPLTIRGRSESGATLLSIRSYEVKIISDYELGSSHKEKINGIVGLELGERSHIVSYHVFLQNSFWIQSKTVVTTMLTSTSFWGLGLLLLSLTLCFFGFTYYKNTIWKQKTEANNIYHSNIYELIHFVRSQVSLNKEVLNQVLTNSKEDILGIKALLSYLSAQFRPSTILFASTMVAIENEIDSYDEEQFSNWLRTFSEKLSGHNLRNGNQFKLYGTDKDLVLKIRSIPTKTLSSVLKHIDSSQTYAAVFKIVDGDMVQSILGKFEPELWKEIESVDVKSLDVDKELNRILKILNNTPKKAVKKTKKVTKTSKKHATKDFSWATDNLDQLPPVYLQQKLSTKSFLEISMIMVELKGHVKYHFLKQLPDNIADKVIEKIDSITKEEQDTKFVETFISEIQKDYDQKVFTLKLRKVA
jgi:hypothetical protein